MKTGSPDQSAECVRRYRTFSLRSVVLVVLLLSVLLAITKKTGLLTQQLVWWGFIPERTIITPCHEFAGEKYYLFEIPDSIHVPDNVAITFKDSLDEEFYVLEIERTSRQVLRATPFDAYRKPILVDITGDGVAELVLNENENEPNMEDFNSCMLFPFLTYRDAYGNVEGGDLEVIEVLFEHGIAAYSLAPRVKKLFAQHSVGPRQVICARSCGSQTEGMRRVERLRVETRWADLFGNNLPVLCRVEERIVTTIKGESCGHENTKTLISYWSVEPDGGEWVETECRIPIGGESANGLLAGLDGPQQEYEYKSNREL